MRKLHDVMFFFYECICLCCSHGNTQEEISGYVVIHFGDSARIYTFTCDRCDRICPVCGLNIEDEIHFLFHCPKYSSIRDDFFNKIDNRIPNYKHIPISTLIIQLMNATDYYLNKQLVQYVSSCLEMRDNLISKV